MDTDYEPVNDIVDIVDIIEDLQEIEGDDSEQTDLQTTNVPDPSLAYLYSQHPETILEYVEEVTPKITPSANNIRKSIPFLTTFERTKVLGFRTTQLSQGARPFITVPEHVSDIKEIARLELEARRLPFIIRRPMPNGTFEYWRISDLMII